MADTFIGSAWAGAIPRLVEHDLRHRTAGALAARDTRERKEVERELSKCDEADVARLETLKARWFDLNQSIKERREDQRSCVEEILCIIDETGQGVLFDPSSQTSGNGQTAAPDSDSSPPPEPREAAQSADSGASRRIPATPDAAPSGGDPQWWTGPFSDLPGNQVVVVKRPRIESLKVLEATLAWDLEMFDGGVTAAGVMARIVSGEAQDLIYRERLRGGVLRAACQAIANSHCAEPCPSLAALVPEIAEAVSGDAADRVRKAVKPIIEVLGLANFPVSAAP